MASEVRLINNKFIVEPGQISPWYTPAAPATLRLSTTREDDPRDLVGIVTLVHDHARIELLNDASVIWVNREFCLFSVNDQTQRVAISNPGGGQRARPLWLTKLIEGFLGGIAVAACESPPRGLLLEPRLRTPAGSAAQVRPGVR